jgi:hypothetical protein
MIASLLTLVATVHPMFIGDSIMAQVGQGAPSGITVLAKVGSGLANPRLRDWSKVTFTSGSTVVVIMGTNDGQNIRGHRCGTPEWSDIYRARVGVLMDKVEHKKLLWILPGRTGSIDFDNRLVYVRQAITSEAMVRGVKTLDLQVILDEVHGHNPRYHSKDGIHLNLKGVRLVQAEINKWFTSTAG